MVNGPSPAPAPAPALILKHRMFHFEPEVKRLPHGLFKQLANALGINSSKSGKSAMQIICVKLAALNEIIDKGMLDN